MLSDGMYGNVNRKKHPDGGHYRNYFYYTCKHRTYVDGHKCSYRKQWNEEKINVTVEEVIRSSKLNSIDIAELDREYDGLKEQLKQVTGAKNKLASQMDSLSVSDKHYDKKYNDMQERLDKLYDRFTDVEKKMFLKSFLDAVYIYEDAKEDGRILKGLKFKFPVFFNGQEIAELDWDNESTVEALALLVRERSDRRSN
jgi:site-specific DNA recombinase